MESIKMTLSEQQAFFNEFEEWLHMKAKTDNFFIQEMKWVIYTLMYE
jgi:hypothetical protein